MMHGGDIILFLIELNMNKIIYVWGHSIIYLVNIALYLAWALNTGKIWPTGGPNGDGYPYSFLNPNDPNMRTQMAILIVVSIVIWLLAFVLNNIRARIGKLFEAKTQEKEAQNNMRVVPQATGNI
jgi:hypothetical protein